MKSDPWDKTQIEQLRKIASEGYTSSEAASMMGRTHYGVRSASTRYGVRWNAFKKLPLPDGSPRAIRHYGDDGVAGAFACRVAQTGMRATSKHYGFSYNTTKMMNRRMKENLG